MSAFVNKGDNDASIPMVRRSNLGVVTYRKRGDYDGKFDYDMIWFLSIYWTCCMKYSLFQDAGPIVSSEWPVVNPCTFVICMAIFP